MFKVMLIGPTSKNWSLIAEDVEADLSRLKCPNTELTYRTTGAGPLSVRSLADVEAAAPHVMRTVLAARREGFDAVIVDCTDDPGTMQAQELVDIPVVGAGAALQMALARSPEPKYELTGEELRTLHIDDIYERVHGAATVALGATGFSDLADAIAQRSPQTVVLDPLELALDSCLRQLGASR